VRIIFAPRVFLFSTSQLILFLGACRANAPAVECVVFFVLGRVSESTRPTATLTCISERASERPIFIPRARGRKSCVPSRSQLIGRTLFVRPTLIYTRHQETPSARLTEMVAAQFGRPRRCCFGTHRGPFISTCALHSLLSAFVRRDAFVFNWGPPTALARQQDPDALRQNGFIYVFASSWIEVAPWVGLSIHF
jgi:hypothetical protein